MSSSFATNDVRLKVFGNLPMKFLGVDGDFEYEKGNVNFHCLIKASDLVPFIIDCFPPPVFNGNIAIPQTKALPGLPGLVAQKVTFKEHTEGLPTDPFGFDTTAPEGTYGERLAITVQFGPRVNVQPNKNDPRTFLEITGNDTGEFIHSTAPKAKWQLEKKNEQNLSDETDPGTVNPGDTKAETDDPSPKKAETTTTETQKDPTIPMMILVPHTEWSVKWKQIPFYYFFNVLIRRLRWCLGRVNQTSVPLLFNAYPETLLFMGYNYTQVYTWRDGEINIPPVDIEMKFVEKRVVWSDGLIKGHNHFWRPGKGWQRLLIDGTNSTYAQRDMNVIWTPEEEE